VGKKKHLYNSRIGKVRWFVERFGARELVMKPLRMVLAPLIIPTLGEKTFPFQGKPLPYLLHRYNMTWASERCVEVPIARSILQTYPPGETLEVGNVLSHYGPVQHDILDKFEKGAGVINEDVITFTPAKRYGLIISISTFEHIGFDDETEGSSAEKIKDAIKACLNLLQPNGRLVITVPIGYNPELDSMLLQSGLGSREESYLKKYGSLDWRECSKNEALACRYKKPFPYANAIAVAHFVDDQGI
jgi:hypothetical protein